MARRRPKTPDEIALWQEMIYHLAFSAARRAYRLGTFTPLPWAGECILVVPLHDATFTHTVVI